MKYFPVEVPSSSYYNQLNGDGHCLVQVPQPAGEYLLGTQQNSPPLHDMVICSPGHGEFQARVSGPCPTVQPDLELNHLIGLSSPPLHR